MSDDTETAAPQPDTNRETIVIAVGPNADGHAHQAVASQTRTDEAGAPVTDSGTTEMAARHASVGHTTTEG